MVPGHLIFFPALVPVVFLYFLYSRVTPFSFSFFLTGAAFEWGMGLVLVYLNEKRILQGRFFRLLDYYLRMLLGLPLTVYFSAMGPEAFVGLLRLFPQLVYNRFLFGRGGTVVSALLFLSGFLIFVLIRTEGRPEQGDLVGALFFAIILPLALFGIDRWARSFRAELRYRALVAREKTASNSIDRP